VPDHKEHKEDAIVTDPADLEQRIRILEDIEAIKKLKAKYWRCIDKKLWNELEECFSEDVIVDYGPDMQFRGRKALLEFFKDVLGNDSMITVHAGYSAEIEIISDTTAKGVWALSDYVITEPDSKMRGWAHYSDEYIKENGKWKIKSAKITRIRQELITTKT
jgi:hypothetical protein